MKSKQYYIGLLSGTSADAIDAALVLFEENQSVELIAKSETPFKPELQHAIIAFNESAENELERMGELSVKLGLAFAEAANALLKKTGLKNTQILAIGSHGQTIRHRPNNASPFTLQIGDPNIIASKTGIITIADFRRKDMALGGQGAPLAPGLHQALFRTEEQDRIVLNLGGIANITILPKDPAKPVIGFDTGPASCLMNAWIYQHQQKSFDNNGAWASSGKILGVLLKTLLEEAYFSQPAPKSTGREYFNLSWFYRYLSGDEKPEDVQATLLALTVTSIANDIQRYCEDGELIVCGGGVHNTLLMAHLSEALKPLTVVSSQHYGVDPDFVEALLFAWLAKQTLTHQPGNLPSVTGAKRAAVLGGIYWP